MSELKRTQLYDAHVAAGADMVDFGGWEMPIQYPTGIVAEHLYTRHACGLFDVSHMGNDSAGDYLARLAADLAQTARNVRRRFRKVEAGFRMPVQPAAIGDDVVPQSFGFFDVPQFAHGSRSCLASHITPFFKSLSATKAPAGKLQVGYNTA